MSSPVVVDGYLTLEKLEELLALQAEHAELDFKTTIDLSSAKHRLGLVKDMVAMANTPTGGYLILGVNEDGSLATNAAPLRVRSFDSADLAQLLSRYVSTPIVITSQAHQLSGRDVVIIHVTATSTRLPAIVNKIGDFEDDSGRMKTVFRDGVIYIREGTHTIAATDSHWPSVLERYRAQVVAESRHGIDELIRRVVESMSVTGGPVPRPPLDLEMDDASFLAALRQHIDAGEGDRTLLRFIREARDALAYTSSAAVQENGMTRLAAVAIAAVFADDRTIFGATIDQFYEGYVAAYRAEASSTEKAAYWLKIALRTMCIGAVAVRHRAWWTIKPMTDLPVDDYFLIWIRHALTTASREDLLSGGQRANGALLSMARELASSEPLLREDLPQVDVVAPGELAARTDRLMGSLCEFDFLWNVTATASHPDTRWGSISYPSFASFDLRRTQPVWLRLAHDEDMRRQLLPGRTDAEVAQAVADTLDAAVAQSHQTLRGGWWRNDLGEPVLKFLQDQGVSLSR